MDDKCCNVICVSPEKINLTAVAFASVISQNLDNDSTSVLGSFFSALGNMLTLTAKQRALLKTCCCPPDLTTDSSAKKA